MSDTNETARDIVVVGASAGGPLFRTAAREFGFRMAGVIRSATLDDGAAGMRAVKEADGSTVVQDPADAVYDGMPRAATAAARPDHVVPAAEIPRVLLELAGGEVHNLAVANGELQDVASGGEPAEEPAGDASVSSAPIAATSVPRRASTRRRRSMEVETA